MLGCQPSDIVWTSGATESNNQVMHHFARTLPAEAAVLVFALEHPSVAEAAAHYFGHRVQAIPSRPGGVPDLQ